MEVKLPMRSLTDQLPVIQDKKLNEGLNDFFLTSSRVVLSPVLTSFLWCQMIFAALEKLQPWPFLPDSAW